MPLDPRPRFKPDVHMQCDVVWGHLDSQIEAEHLARAIWKIVEAFDVSALERGYSALGRHGYSPRRLMALWIYASLVGEHDASKVERRCVTDSAFRWICGGQTPSVSTLKRFRANAGEVLAIALTTTIRLAGELDLIDVGDLATDSVRLRAHAATSAARTLERSRARLAQLLAQSLDDVSDEEREAHARKVHKHQDAIARCERTQRSNVVVTNELAGLLKFPNGASAPGHRVTVTAAGISSRIVLSVLIDADSNDYGKLIPSVERARAALAEAGQLDDRRFDVAADAGYFSNEDLCAARARSEWLDVVVGTSETGGIRAGKKYFGRDRFEISLDEAPRCPAGRAMGSLHVRSDGTQEWAGVGCSKCSLRPSCTPSATRPRRLNIVPEIELMRRCMAEPARKARYNRRIATVEPVFSNVVDTMAYSRVTSRHARTIRAEILLKLVSHNVARILSARRLRLAHFAFDQF